MQINHAYRWRRTRMEGDFALLMGRDHLGGVTSTCCTKDGTWARGVGQVLARGYLLQDASATCWPSTARWTS